MQVRPTVVIWFLAAVSAVLLGIVVLALGDAADSGAAAPCRPELRRGVLPVWARGGFSEAEPRIAHALGRDGEIAAMSARTRSTSPTRREARPAACRR